MARQKAAKKTRTLVQECFGVALEHWSIGASMKGFFRIGKLNGKTKGGKENNVRVRGPWLHHHHGINNWREKRMLTIECPLYWFESFFEELCKEGVWVVSIQDIGSSCSCPFFCPFTPSGPIISTFKMSCNAQEILPASASQNQARHIYRGYS